MRHNVIRETETQVHLATRVYETYTLGKRSAGTDEETGTDGTTNGNHVQMARLHLTIKLDETVAIVLALEGLEVETTAG